MKTYLSAFTSLLFLVALTGCGKEQFGSTPQNTSTQTDPLKSFQHQSCSTYTLIKPKVDIVYVVDNSASSGYFTGDIKKAIQNTINSLSQDFDYRVVKTPLIETDSVNEDYQVMSNSPELAGINNSKIVNSTSEFTFFENASGGGQEPGLSRVQSFLSYHAGNLLRTKAYTIVVLVSNGYDTELEKSAGYGNNETIPDNTKYNSIFTSLKNLAKVSSPLSPLQLRLITATAHTSCKSGWLSSQKSYVKMSKDLYLASGASDQNSSATPDSYDLCSTNVANIFKSINSAIHQVRIDHSYRYWPINFAENNESVSLAEIQVKRVAPDGTKTDLVRNTDWTYVDKVTPQLVDTRELPTLGEPILGRHFIRFNNKLIKFPDCVLITSVSRTELFEYIALPSKPQTTSSGKVSGIIKVNGVALPEGVMDPPKLIFTTHNIKADYPTPGDNNPPVIRSGFMIKINNPAYYYKSGDNLEMSYLPAGI